MTPEQYLDKIYGPGALRLQLDTNNGIIEGIFNDTLKPQKLFDYETEAQRSIRLIVTNDQLAGHFSDPKTLPAYRMVEFAANTSDFPLVIGLRNANFLKIVQPGDRLVTYKDFDRFNLTRSNKTVAHFEMVFGSSGFSPQYFGLLAEIAAQTIIVNDVKDLNLEGDMQYPLITKIGSIDAQNNHSFRSLRAIPGVIESSGKGKLKGSVRITGERGKEVANISGIEFQFATAKRISFMSQVQRRF